MKVIHSWLKEYVGEKLPDVNQVEELLNSYAFEVDGISEEAGETVIDVSILPNRASDCLCHRGIARELATILNCELEKDPLREKIDLISTEEISVEISDSEACPRFTVSLIKGIKVKDSPEWLQKKLRALGQRPINNIVDATNYVMYAIGQPIHAYDADLFSQVDGKWQFGVRFANEKETISLLSEGGKDEDRVVELNGSELLIVDGSTNTPIGLAGVKGGRYASIHKDTKNIIIEAAHFHPTITRKTARRLGIVIEASKRFENEPSRELPLYAQREIVSLITDIAGGEFNGVLDEYLIPQNHSEVFVTVTKTNSLLGLSLDLEEIEAIIKKTGSRIVEKTSDRLKVISPFERTDLNIEEDFIEEIGRIYGLSYIESVVPKPLSIKVINKTQYYEEKIRQTLLQIGFSEIVTTSFQRQGVLQLKNALASDKSYMRSSLRNNVTSVLDANFAYCDLLGIEDIRVFEIGTVFEKIKNGVTENISLALGVRTKGNGYNTKDDVILKSGCVAVEEILGTKLDWQNEKGVTEANLSLCIKNLSIPNNYEPLPEKQSITYNSISAYPAIARDIALWVPVGTEVEAVSNVLATAAKPLLVRITLFDTFEKNDRISYAFRLVFQSKERTLTDAEINSIMEKIYKISVDSDWEVR